MTTLLNPPVELGLETRKKRAIKNRLDRSLPAAGLQLAVTHHRTNYLTGKHRPVGPCNTYNCHGLTFGSRRTWIGGVDDIENILVEDDYKIVPFAEVMAGDIAIYRKDGAIDHSGIVVSKESLTVMVLSKWGNLHEVVHPVLDCPYNDCQVSYYRVSA